MNVMVSSSPAPIAQPPRSNPFLRSSSDAPPFPCITPSTVTCVMVVSLMVDFLRLGAAPRGRPHPCYDDARLFPTPLPDFFEESSGTSVVSGREPWGRAPPPCARTRSVWDSAGGARGRPAAAAEPHLMRAVQIIRLGG